MEQLAIEPPRGRSGAHRVVASGAQRTAVALAALLALAACASPPPPASGAPPTLEALRALHLRRDFFALREGLGRLSGAAAGAPELLFLVAAEQQAFNRSEDAARTLALLDRRNGTLPPGLAAEIEGLRLTNALRRHRYAEALGAARSILERRASPALLAEARHQIPLLEALADVPPQETEIRAPTRLLLGPTGRVPLAIEGVEHRFALDTGANLSVMMRSEAERTGLAVRPAGVEVNTSTGETLRADVAVARDVVLGGVGFRQVVFLVFPDEALSFPGGPTIPGLIGFPLVEGMQEVRFRRDNVLEVPFRAPTRSPSNLALDGLDPLVGIRYGRDRLVCRLDSGANRSVFYEPFYRRYRRHVDAVGEPVTARAGAVGGVREIPARRLPKMVFTVAGAGVTLRGVEVYTEAIRAPRDNFLDCNLGLDVLGRFRAWVVNLRDMALVLE